MKKHFTLFFLISVLFFFMQSNAKAQAFTENFDDITSLTGNGWLMQNNSSPIGSSGWFQGNDVANSGPFDAYNGASDAYIAADLNNTGSTGTISNWLITPNRIFSNCDTLSFYTRSTLASVKPDRLEVRLSTNGTSSDVGSGATATGDFSLQLLSINTNLVAGVYPQTWTQYTIIISGLSTPTSGRIAFRYFVTSGGSSDSNADYIGIDNVVYKPFNCINPLNQTLTVSQSTICPEGGSTTIDLASSETDVKYYLRVDSNNAIVAGPVVGTGNGVSLNTGNVTSTTTYNVYAEKVNSRALEFTGNSGLKKVSLGTNLYTDNIAGTTQLTVEAWIKRSSLGSLHTILSNYQGSYPLLLRIDNDKLNFHINSSTNVQSNNTIPAGVWTHVAATYSGTQIMVYINGVLEGSQPYNQPFNSSLNELKIGAGLSNNTEYFPGDIADVRIWNYERSATQISNSMNQLLTATESGLIANYQFSETSGNTATNSAVGNLYPGTLINNPSWVAGPPALNPPVCSQEMTQLITISVNDLTAPVPDITNLPDITAECEVTSLTTPTATDNCSGNTSLTILPPASIAGENTNLGVSNLGPQVFAISGQCVIAQDVTPDAYVCDSIPADLTGKIAVIRKGICSFQLKLHNVQVKGAIGVIIINDQGGTTVEDILDTDPSIVMPTFMISENDGLALMNEIGLGNVSVIMKRTNPVTITHNASLPITTQGTTAVTWTYDDGNGNTTTQNQNVIIQDITNPTISCPGDQTEIPTGSCDFTLPDYTGLGIASDNCVTAPTITQSPVPGTIISGNTMITLTATDAASNTSTCTFEVLLPTIPTIDNTIDNSLTPQLTSNQAGASYQWINCDNGNSPISGETNQTFTATASGNYAVVVTVGACSDTSACESVTFVGLKELNSSPVSIYPNPTSGIFTIDFSTNIGVVNFSIVTVDGRVVLEDTTSETKLKLDLNNVSNGIYFMHLNGNSLNSVFKIVKQSY
ncbi:MAG: choice-of-anchor J domain-containing protein [Bacteroidota bacterium]|nr:choice-of-anchor J domain-containing protein [Bacteroidota bacterium]